MARVEPVDSDSDAGNISARSKKKMAKDKKSPEVDESNVDADGEKSSGEEGNENEEDEEEEYEIEEILDAKRGTFPGGRLGYLVKWKGYDSSHNSWVDEKDAGNATLLIDAFWKKSKKDKGARKSLESRHKTPKAKKSLDGSEIGSTSAKKRGRPKFREEKEASDVEDDDRVPKKKPRKSNGADTKSAKKAGPGKNTSEPGDEGQDMEEMPVGNMDDYMKVPSWEHLVATIDTVERTTEEELDVYFKLINGDSVRVDARTCALKFPQKLITFYESNLRWKLSDS